MDIGSEIAENVNKASARIYSLVNSNNIVLRTDKPTIRIISAYLIMNDSIKKLTLLNKEVLSNWTSILGKEAIDMLNQGGEILLIFEGGNYILLTSSETANSTTVTQIPNINVLSVYLVATGTVKDVDNFLEHGPLEVDYVNLWDGAVLYPGDTYIVKGTRGTDTQPVYNVTLYDNNTLSMTVVTQTLYPRPDLCAYIVKPIRYEHTENVTINYSIVLDGSDRYLPLKYSIVIYAVEGDFPRGFIVHPTSITRIAIAGDISYKIIVGSTPFNYMIPLQINSTSGKRFNLMYNGSITLNTPSTSGYLFFGIQFVGDLDNMRITIELHADAN